MTDTAKEKANPFDVFPRNEVKEADFTETPPEVSHMRDGEPEPQTAPPPPEQKKEEPKDKTVALIPIGPDGRVMVQDNSQLMRYCGALVAGGGVPKRFDNPTKLFAALMFVRDLKLPDTAIRQVADIHGVMSAFGDVPLALVQRTNKLVGFREAWFDKDYKEINFENQNLEAEVWGAVCFGGREDGVTQSFSFTMKDAERAGLYPAKKRDGSPSPDSPWMKYTRMMLRYKARSIMLKSLFADAINGMSIAEYDFDEINPDNATPRDVTPKSSGLNEKVEDLNKTKE